jgi:proteasome lid subunit RPN8/RPN11
MLSLFRTLLRAASGQPPKLVCAPQTWHEGVDELRRRAAGWQESGAFLLGTRRNGVRNVRRFLFYDDVDPTCFARGIVEFDGRKFGTVWQRCRDLKMTVVADVHVHPGYYRQSPSDRHNPMIAEAGHFALIVPDYAARARMPGAMGIYEYLGNRQWQDHSSLADRVFHVGWWPK